MNDIESIPIKQGKPDGWWSLEDLHGTREGVLKAVKQSDAPEHWKNVVIIEINALDKKYNLVKINAHFHISHGHSILHLGITPSVGLQ